MTAKATHPLYDAMNSKWTRGTDSYAGSDKIKSKGAEYLPQTSGQIEDGALTGSTTKGAKAYESYKLRAVYPDIYKDAVNGTVGILHREPPKIDLPNVLEGMRDNCTSSGESLEMLLRKINSMQLISGRLGLLADIAVGNGVEKPVIVIYNEMSIRNWDDVAVEENNTTLKMLILDETNYELQSDYTWMLKEQYRFMTLTSKSDPTKVEFPGYYTTQLLDAGDQIRLTDAAKVPSLKGVALEEIPFVFVNSKDLSPTPDLPPLDGLAEICLTIYRGEADYRQSLFMQGQDTLVRIGAGGGDDDGVRVGTGAMLDVPMGGDAKFIGVNSSGLSEQREALENDYNRAQQKSGQLLDTTSRSKESGDALRVRVAAQTATLPEIAKTGASALENVLKHLARWYGANPDEVKVTPNLNFSEADLNGETLLKIVQSKGLGAPISQESIHEWMQDQGFTKVTYAEELDRIAEEEPMVPTGITSPVDNGKA